MPDFQKVATLDEIPAGGRKSVVFDDRAVLVLRIGNDVYADENGSRRIGFSVDDRADVDIMDLVRERDSIEKISDSVTRAAALARWQAPRNGVPLAARRVFVGRDRSKSAIVNLADRDGKPRLRMLVDSTGAARIEFLDPDGRVT